MVKLFTKIRHGLLTEQKFSQYLLYAIGEIVLVVIGILIALQINNWNEERKAASLELAMLKNLHDDIKDNVARIKGVYSSDSILAAQNRRLMYILQNEQSVYHDSLQAYFGWISRYNVFSPRKMAYEALKSEGLETIKNDSVRSSIILLYDESYLINTLMLELKKDIHIQSISLFNKKLYIPKEVGHSVPIDFKALKLDNEFINNLSYITAESESFLKHYKGILSNTISAGEKIEKEIKRLKGL